MCSGRASSTSSSPPATATAARYVAAWMRSDTVRWPAAFNDPRSTPLTTMPRRPDAADVGTHLDEHVAHVDDLWLAGGVVDRRRPVGEHGGRDDVLRGADAREREGDVGAVQPVGRRVQLAVGELELAPIASSPAMCMSIGRAPKSSPPGIDRRTSPQRVSSGPSTLIDARIRSTSSYGATGTRSPSLVRTSVPGSGLCERTPRAASSSPMIATSLIAGHVGELVHPVGEQARRHQLEHRVLRPGDPDRALQRAEMADRDLLGGSPGLVHRPASMLRP